MWRIRDTVHPPVLCNRIKPHGQLSWMPASSKRPSTREAVRRIPRAVSATSTMAAARSAPAPPPQTTLQHPLTIWVSHNYY
ncbi:hypothetical protein EVAR_98260_1 [Eumeta japonica]|uniref:Uncharacterized protein n=1 Tax=Eumeta variegata TaxID=151549 RepID=A0A4C2A0J2_EUMVA|nr:hypothetical protein EVAR_98260_1 [Eumeta japonica]